MSYTLPKLPYAYDDLEPFIDARTMEIHHTKHHQGYVDKLNAVLEKYPAVASAFVKTSADKKAMAGRPSLQDRELADLLQNLKTLPMDEKDKIIFKNNAGGHLNHSLFWEIMAPQKSPDQNLIDRINKEFGSLEEFKKKFSAAALGVFGSGWCWLAMSEQSESNGLSIITTPNQDSPLMIKDKGLKIILGLDIWEHAYYLKYQNRRAEYIENWWQVLKLF
ncbi:hypothetical protein A3A09_02270 [Candidatus Nomurabacteria bacterium RIFCSPLOWO2_01_FULL_42_20]|uniref:Superoxide dismutase n=1 Tax=Candidatus Nomurabacteria bacterium RIFCSPHIGHO2_01_FULL_42_16 TaxID=1801743 RepID=A0A1F6VHP8_9BACT|nr:MAG: hypothetical protein A2824_01990 [Candidatus Nomurabacteria bacterium RIFCSPHIGHO2_01_FULL_42_16]OGI92105.1 MAG: hypothetical protein A3A09_02270 [Candidatus Nomurabacteria bacterium RIFCSPLOWO2_01_FULL_42_20]